jgi:hypothetical protein
MNGNMFKGVGKLAIVGIIIVIILIGLGIASCLNLIF